MAEAVLDAEAAAGGGKRRWGGGRGKVIGQALLGILLVGACVVAFLVFYVGPQSQHERDRIFRSMNYISRLIDDRTLATGHALQTWQSEPTGQALDAAEQQFGIVGLRFGCDRKNIICIHDYRKGQAVSRESAASISLRSIAESAELPYDEAILLIADTRGSVIAGHDSQRRWLQFSSLRELLDTAETALAGDPKDVEARLRGMLQNAQRFGRGEQNTLFSGYPARLSRDVGGQTYAVFVASHQLGRSLTEDDYGALTATVQAQAPPASGATGAAIRASASELSSTRTALADAGEPGKERRAEASTTEAPHPGDVDQLFFAILIPERVIDGTALAIPFQWTVNILLVLVAAILAIPLIKLFSRSCLKPIRTSDMAAVVISVMLIVTTAALLFTAVLTRNSVVREIDAELADLTDRVADEVIAGLDLTAFEEAAGDLGSERTLEEYEYTFPQVAGVVNAFQIGETGRCAQPGAIIGCGEGIHWNEPNLENITVTDRAYFRAWRSKFKTGERYYTQFIKNKATGGLSWSRFIDMSRGPVKDLKPEPEVVRKAAEQASQEQTQAQEVDRGLLVSWFPLSLRAPILARNFSFAIVLNEDLPEVLKGPGSSRMGDVQYHSDQQHSLMENLIDEARDDPQLVAALRVFRGRQASVVTEAANERPGWDQTVALLNVAAAGASSDDEADTVVSERLSLSYHGRNFFSRVRPIGDTPWSVVAFYDRSEALAIFAETILQSFFLACLWVLLCLATAWMTPRFGRFSLHRQSNRRKLLPIRTRSIWFFPNALVARAGDGLSYNSRIRSDESILLLGTLAGQVLCIIALPAILSMLGIFVISLVSLGLHYIMMVRPYRINQSMRLRRASLVLSIAVFSALIFFAIGRQAANNWLPLVMAALIGCFVFLALGPLSRLNSASGHIAPLLSWRQRSFGKRVVATGERISSRKANCAVIRGAYLNRTVAMLLVLVWMPTMGIFNFYYSEYLRGYIGVSLAHVAEQIEEQNRVLTEDLQPLVESEVWGVHRGREPPAESIVSSTRGKVSLQDLGELLQAHGFLTLSPWSVRQVSCPEPAAAEPANGASAQQSPTQSTPFRAEVPSGTSGTRKACRALPFAKYSAAYAIRWTAHPGWFLDDGSKPSAGSFAVTHDSGELGRVGSARNDWASFMVERFGGTMPRFFQSNVEIENSARLLGRTGQLQTLGLQDTALPEADYGLEGKSSNPFRLSARPFDPPALNPDPNGWIFALMYLLVFYLVLFRLLERTAAILAGLYLEVTEPLPGAVEALNQLIAEPLGPQRAWDALESREERLLLLSLAQGRTLNFRERGTIQALVQKGYLRLTPYLHITHEKLTNYLKHDLPQGQRADALKLVKAEDDTWEHLRVPVLVVVGLGCALLAYTSPGVVQLVMSGFLALTALLPLARDPITQIYQMRRA